MLIKILGRTKIPVFTIGIGTGMLGVQKPEDRLAVYNGSPHLMDIDLGVQTLTIALEGLIQAAKDQGCKPGDAYFIVDTAAYYGDRRSEKAIGKTLDANPEFQKWTLITTKVGQTYGQTNTGFGRIDYSLESLVNCLRQSEELTRVKFPIVYLHDPMGLSKATVLEAWQALTSAGMADFVGVAANDPSTTEELLATGQFPVAVVPEAVSLINRRIEIGILPAAEKFATALVAATVIERGLLTNSPISPGPYLSRHFTPDCLAHVAEIRTTCKELGFTLGAAAVQWPAYRYSAISCSLIGISTPQDSKDLVESATSQISKSAWEKLEASVKHFSGQREIWTPSGIRDE